jgi:hypothetical protein
MSSTTLKAALAAAERGWHVFPVRPNDKRPAIRDWEHRATTNLARIERCWNTQPFNIGIATGPSGLVVVDLDTPKPGQQQPTEWNKEGIANGEDVLAALAERHGPEHSFARLYDTFTVRTPSGGTHLYYQQPHGVELRNTAGKLGWLIDTRAHGGYVLASGSALDGKPYAISNDTIAAPLPDWVFQFLAAPQPAPHMRVATTSTTPPTGGHLHPIQTPRVDRLQAYLHSALEREVDRVRTAHQGQRNHALYIASVALGQLLAAGHLTHPIVTATLWRAAADHLAVGAYTPAEAAATIASGLRSGAKKPRHLSPHPNRRAA